MALVVLCCGYRTNHLLHDKPLLQLAFKHCSHYQCPTLILQANVMRRNDVEPELTKSVTKNICHYLISWVANQKISTLR